MASTRNKNTQNNYAMEKRELINASDYLTCKSYGIVETAYHPGDGLLAGKTCRNVLSNNACDIESQLFGIGANNLETPLPDVTPQCNNLKSLNVFEKPVVYVVEPRIAKKDQRPMIYN